MMRKKSYDLLITDLKMAEVNGIEILEMMILLSCKDTYFDDRFQNSK